MVAGKTSPEETTSYLRKVRKPLVERRHRERMNQSIDQLKDLITDTIKHNVAPMTRVDKADILELTVTHIAQLKQQQQQQRGLATTSGSSGYCSGYKECARAVIDFLISNSLVRKPLVEKRRRERMNQSIDQLKDLITDTIKHNVAPMTRVDKADILELTVTHIAQLKQQQQQQRGLATTSGSSGYCSGYKECARAVIDFLISNSLVGGTALNDLSGHLHNAYLHKSRSEHTSTTRNKDIHHSTPMRPQTIIEQTTSTPAQLFGYSPILQITPEVFTYEETVGTCYKNSVYLGYSCEVSGTSSNRVDSKRDSCSYSSMDYSSKASSVDSSINTDIVTIGDGRENAIGHVIKDTVWRPW